MPVRFVFIGLLFLLLFGISCGVSAHSSGPPYIMLNGEYAKRNPILEFIEPEKFELGEDVATPSGYVVNQPIAFVIDEEFFPNPYLHDSAKPSFRWDFGDETPKTEGKVVRHSYSKPGTYIVRLEVKYPGNADEFTEINSVQTDVFPSRDYVRPEPKISINGKSVADPTKEGTEVKSGRPVTFDASGSPGDIVSYTWDFADGSSGEGKTVTHRYGRGEFFPLFPVLRVTDKNNIVSDTVVLLNIPPQSDNIFLRLYSFIEDIFARIFFR